MMVVTTVNGEDDVPVCLDACSDTWEEEFFDNLGQEDQGKEQDEEAILSLEDIQLFLESRGCLQDAMQVGNFYGQFICCADSHCKQTTLHDFNSSGFHLTLLFLCDLFIFT